MHIIFTGNMHLGWVGRASDCSASVACPIVAGCAMIELYFVTQTIFLPQILCFWMLSIVLSLSKSTVYLDKDRMMDNVQKHYIYTDVPSSQTFRSYFLTRLSSTLTLFISMPVYV
jgi:hypothetical protein